MGMNIEINEHVQKEFEYIVELHQKYGASNKMNNVEDLINFVLASVADGSRRPGSWERDLLHPMGLIVDCDEHHQHHSEYGATV